MSAPDFTGIGGVVSEVTVRQHAVFVPLQAIRTNVPGIEFHLSFHVFGVSLQRARQLFHKHPAGFANGIHVSVVALAIVGDPLEFSVLIDYPFRIQGYSGIRFPQSVDE